ncbi:hypothetical protein SMD11_1181 [Streptomyces albireticuli]|uniref:Uncharacterized protein n=1 Tax=Streptomyces albireticuli TaxID=1940 RepID=A0A1Z2KXS1_9ACTN|nr:hypothetical protein SMD11_1181 [Streptomyces albireticuli]
MRHRAVTFSGSWGAAGLAPVQLEAVPGVHEVVIDPEVTESLLLVLLALPLPPQHPHEGLIHVDDRALVAVLGQLPQSVGVAFLDHDPRQLDGALFPVDE